MKGSHVFDLGEEILYLVKKGGKKKWTNLEDLKEKMKIVEDFEEKALEHKNRLEEKKSD